MKKPFIALTVALLGLMSQQTRAAVVVSNFDPAEFYPTGPYASASAIGQAVSLGDTSVSLTSVLIPQPDKEITGEKLGVFSRNANGTLGTLEFDDFTLKYDNYANVTYAPVGSGFTLQANTSYFFVLISTTNGDIKWNDSSNTSYSSAFGASLPSTDTSFTSDGAGHTTYSNLAQDPQVIEVSGSAVPEPSSAAFIGLTLAGGALFLKRRRMAA